MIEPLLINSLEGSDIVDISGGNSHSLVLNRNGEVFAFGRGREGQLGLGDYKDAKLPTRVKENGLSDCIIKKICAGDCCSAAITNRGELFEWGYIHAPEDHESQATSNALPGLVKEATWMSERVKKLLRDSTLQYLRGDGDKEENVEMTQEQIDAEAGILRVRTRRQMQYLPVKARFKHRVKDIALGYGHSLIIVDGSCTVWAKGYNGKS